MPAARRDYGLTSRNITFVRTGGPRHDLPFDLHRHDLGGTNGSDDVFIGSVTALNDLNAFPQFTQDGSPNDYPA